MSSSGTDSPIKSLHPSSVSEVVEAVRDGRRLIPYGGNSKPPLSRSVHDAFGHDTGARDNLGLKTFERETLGRENRKHAASDPAGGDAVDDADGVRLCMAGLSGIVAYDPAEFTIRVLAGTPVQTIVDELATHGQYLPMDPPRLRPPAFGDSGADTRSGEPAGTIGGAVAAGISGPGRFRFGGVRDFLLGCTVVDGRGQIIHGGGHVVKNAAGFDLPKWMVGSCGRQGILVELTLKVFPRPPAKISVDLEFASADEPIDAMIAAASWIGRQPWDLDAVHLSFEDHRLSYRIADAEAPAAALADRTIAGVQQRFGVDVRKHAMMSSLESDPIDRFRDGHWLSSEDVWVRMPMPEDCARWIQRIRSECPSARCQGSIAATVLDLACSANDHASLIRVIESENRFAMRVRGDAGGPWIGRFPALALRQRAAKVMDPDGRFVWP